MPSAKDVAMFEARRSQLATEFVGSVDDFTPLWDYLLVKIIEREQVTAGGIHMPENYVPKLELKRAKVIKAGSGAYRESGAFIPNPIKEGDVIYMMGHTSPFETYIKVNGVAEKHLLLAGRDCVAVEKRHPVTNSLKMAEEIAKEAPCCNEQAEPGKGGVK